MKVIKYVFCGNSAEMTWSEKNEEIAKREADNGEYTIADDGQTEQEEDANEIPN